MCTNYDDSLHCHNIIRIFDLYDHAHVKTYTITTM